MSEIDFDCSLSSINSSLSDDPPPKKESVLAYPTKKGIL